ncbi:hypothetical protein FDF74_03740 [Clostridium niameyense]|uniref:Uncharacterized protein n=1 Tax=Clostridium niameyense TaxID=1622073 RepID=A0A6M0R7X0_9CLOT|nr:hypothetical protein [Clostridium niameyense]
MKNCITHVLKDNKKVIRMKGNFIPYWYLEKNYLKYKKVCIIASVIWLFASVFIGFSIIKNIKSIKEIDSKLNKISMKQKFNKIPNYDKEHTINSFNSIESILDDNITINKILVKGKNIQLEFSCNYIKSYYDFIHNLEENKNLKIKGTNLLKEDDGIYEFKFVLEER